MTEQKKFKKVILCADDFGISPGVSEGICFLGMHKRISATSVMVVYEDWAQHAENLLKIGNHLDIGLHFTLTDAKPIFTKKKTSSLIGPDGYFHSAGALVKRAFLGRISSPEVYEELKAQYFYFTDALGIKPGYMDGHHNVHQYPSVRHAVVDFLLRERPSMKDEPFYIRNTSNSTANIIKQGNAALKTAPISLLGRSFKSFAQRRDIPTNDNFVGVYNLNNPERFKSYFIQFLRLVNKQNGIIMTHPGLPDGILAKRDSFVAGRKLEYDFLSGNSFNQVLDNHRVTLRKFDNRLELSD